MKLLAIEGRFNINQENGLSDIPATPQCSRRFTPQRIINICFFAVFIFTSLLFWRQGQVLNNGYQASQLNRLENVSAQLGSRMQFRLDNLLFLRNYMRYMLSQPIMPEQKRLLEAEMATLRVQDIWQTGHSHSASPPLNGIGDSQIGLLPSSDRPDNDLWLTEINAAMRLKALLPLTNLNQALQPRIYYISRSGFYLSSTPPRDKSLISGLYTHMLARPYFPMAAPEANPHRKAFWSRMFDNQQDGMLISATAPVDYGDRWWGILGMDFSIKRLNYYLQEALPSHPHSVFMLYDSHFEPITSSDPNWRRGKYFSEAQRLSLQKAVLKQSEGTTRIGTSFVTFTRMENPNITLISLQSLRQGLQDQYGRISLTLVALWCLFVITLIGTHYVISRLVRNMETLQNRLSWRAEHDPLTELLNRRGFFDKAEEITRKGQCYGRSMAIIQVDLDKFKNINDVYGHHVGDLALKHAADTMTSMLRKQDIIGRIGGEEFCIMLPNTVLSEAVAIAERIHTQFNRQNLMLSDGRTVEVTASMGVSACSGTTGCSIESLQSQADKRLYRAKTAGRNQVCASDMDA